MEALYDWVRLNVIKYCRVYEMSRKKTKQKTQPKNKQGNLWGVYGREWSGVGWGGRNKFIVVLSPEEDTSEKWSGGDVPVLRHKANWLHN